MRINWVWVAFLFSQIKNIRKEVVVVVGGGGGVVVVRRTYSCRLLV